MMLQLVIPVQAGDGVVRRGEWVKGPPGSLRRSLGGRSVGIVGMGHIGQAVAKRLEPFGCAIAWHGPRPKPVSWPPISSLSDLAEASDILVVAAMLNDDTHHLIDADIIDKLGQDGLLVNISRGGLVDEDALMSALRSGWLAGAALDVFEEEPTPADKWRDVPNTILTPHIGGHGTAGFENMKKLLLENLRLYFTGQKVMTPV